MNDQAAVYTTEAIRLAVQLNVAGIAGSVTLLTAGDQAGCSAGIAALLFVLGSVAACAAMLGRVYGAEKNDYDELFKDVPFSRERQWLADLAQYCLPFGFVLFLLAAFILIAAAI